MVNIAATGNEELSESAIMCFEICVSVSKFYSITLLSFLDSSKKFCDFALPMPTRKIQNKSIKTYKARHYKTPRLQYNVEKLEMPELALNKISAVSKTLLGIGKISTIFCV